MGVLPRSGAFAPLRWRRERTLLLGMPRKLRLEFPGAIYHIINRGNYCAWIFEGDRTKRAFETCLFEACVRSDWRLHAFVIMDNHFHLAVETPEGNLVAGMQWLQATFANRYNRFRKVHGHLFQGRYKSIVVEPGVWLGRVCHYIHLNPVRAGLAGLGKLADYRYSSLWFLSRPHLRPPFLNVETSLMAAGNLEDRASGWDAYFTFLAGEAGSAFAVPSTEFAGLSRGWAIGSDDFRRQLIRDYDLEATSRAWETSGAQEVREAKWEMALDCVLRSLGRSAADLQHGRKGADWKVAVAAHLKRTTQAGNRWIAQRLNMGSPVAVSQYVSQARSADHPAWSMLRKIEKLKT